MTAIGAVFNAKLLLHLLVAATFMTVNARTHISSPERRNTTCGGRTEITTCGGTANGEHCSFPFQYEGVEYDGCTTVDHDQPWCATRPGLYSEHRKWGNCKFPYTTAIGARTCDGTAYGASCVFPFTYRGVQYYGCTSVDHDRLWCATQLGEKYGWGNCYCNIASVSEFVPRTCYGTANGSACVFPFMYKGMVFTGCTTIESDNDPWCGTQSGEVQSHDQWGYCECASVTSACGGNAGCHFPYIHESVAYYDCIGSPGWCATDSGISNCSCSDTDSETCERTDQGKACMFPFIYDGIKYYACTDVDHDQPWCATQVGDGWVVEDWENCNCPNFTCGGTANGEACAFPFIYDGVEHKNCTMFDHDQPWCSTRPGPYSSHGKWGNCHCWSDLMIGNRTCGGTAHGALCVFPFTYKDVEYHACTSVDHDRPWCATRSWDYTWGNCDCPMSSVSEYVPRTCDGTDGTANGSACVFPFAYYGMVFTGCTTFESDDDPWCATQMGYVQLHDKWGYCECAEVTSACDGNDECLFPFVHESVAYYDCIGSPSWCATKSSKTNCVCSSSDSETCERTTQGQTCVFPFIYDGIKYYRCTDVDDDQPWCATQVGNDWGVEKREYCDCPVFTCGGTANGKVCVFPFTYEDVEYKNCTTVNHDQPWCATQAGRYDDHRLWGNCDCLESGSGDEKGAKKRRALHLERNRHY